VIGGTIGGTAVEDTLPNPVIGQLTIVDPDAGEASFQAGAGNGTNHYGTYTVTTSGAWAYALDNSVPAVQQMTTGSVPLTDTFHGPELRRHDADHHDHDPRHQRRPGDLGRGDGVR